MILGHRIFGKGMNKVLVLHDWFSDCSSYSNVEPYLDTQTFTFVFADLRGYGRSKEKTGKYSADEAAHDLLALLDALHWKTFHIVSHSMTALVAQKILHIAKGRLQSLICITPVPACGSPAPDEAMRFMEDAARNNDESAAQIVHMMTGSRHAKPFIDYKVHLWRETSTAEARVGYLHMFANTDISEQVQGNHVPCLVFVGGHDIEAHNDQRMKETFGQWFANCELKSLSSSGHYPMLEEPVNLADEIDHFLQKHI